MKCPRCKGTGKMPGVMEPEGFIAEFPCDGCGGTGAVPDGGEAGKGEVAVMQYLRPAGMPRKVFSAVGEEHAARAKGMVFSAEVLTTGEIAIYARWDNESREKEFLELAKNGPGPKSPTETLKRLIDRKFEERNPKKEA